MAFPLLYLLSLLSPYRLLENYHAFVLPNALRTTFSGHKRNVKCVCFVGEEGKQIASGSSDNTIKYVPYLTLPYLLPHHPLLRLWNTEDGTNIATLIGHGARIWDISTNNTGKLMASASGDGDVKVLFCRFSNTRV